MSLGYWLVDANVTTAADDQRPYRGLDRQPDIPGPDADSRLASEGREALLDVRNRYWDAEDAGDLHTNPHLAVEFRDVFAVEGVDLEVVRADLVELPELQDVPDDLVALFEERLDRWSVAPDPPIRLITKPLGIDVAFPFPSFHSAIRQPVLDKVFPGYWQELNDAALFSNDSFANWMAQLCNRRETSWRPFCCVRITQVA